MLPIESIQGKCEVRKKKDLPPCDSPVIFQHMFYCEYFYDPSTGSLKQVLCFLFILVIYNPIISFLTSEDELFACFLMSYAYGR